ITTINSALITTLTTSGQTAAYAGNTTDYSANPYSFDGLITQGISGGGYYNSLDGAPFTSDDAGGINEVNTALKYMWDNYKISPTHMYAGSGTINSFVKVLLSAGNASSSF